MKREIYTRIAARLAEPSTWAGASGLAVVFGLSSDEWQAYSNVLAGIFAAVAMLTGEKGPRSADKPAPLGGTLPDGDE
jgi:hypothetical protein